MSNLNRSILFQPKPHNEQEGIVSFLHKKIAAALREYNQNIKWLEQQIEQGHIDKDTLKELSIIVLPKTHKTPIENELSKLYIDPKFASILDNTNIEAPSVTVHLCAKYLTLSMLDKTDFPPICSREITI